MAGNIINFPDEPWRRPGFVCSDRNLARCFNVKHGNDYVYSLARKMWRRFDGTRWIDSGLKVEFEIGEILDEIEPFVAKRQKDHDKIGATKTLLAVERRLRSMHDVDESIFDAHPYLLNCPSGTLDLGSPEMEMRKHDRGEYHSKMTAVDPFGSCPQWEDFIDWVTKGDKQLADYLQRLAGYSLVGVATDQVFAFLFGGGGNGKSVFLNCLLHVLGDYGVTCPSEVFTIQRFEAHPEAIMRLRGARLIVSSEIAAGARWNEERIKAITGGEKVVARGMRESSVEFSFCGTLLIAGNNKPELSAVNNAIKRRMHLVPFAAHIDEDDVNKNLAETLKREAGGILKWMIEGCSAWKMEGLRRPEAVEAATIEYFADEDHVRQWIDECCDYHPDATERTATSTLFASWRNWCEASGLRYGTINQFSTQLVHAGIERANFHSSARGFKGIAIKPKKKAEDGED